MEPIPYNLRLGLGLGGLFFMEGLSEPFFVIISKVQGLEALEMIANGSERLPRCFYIISFMIFISPLFTGFYPFFPSLFRSRP